MHPKGITIPVNTESYDGEVMYKSLDEDGDKTTIIQSEQLQAGTEVLSGKLKCTEDYSARLKRQNDLAQKTNEQADLGIRIVLATLWLTGICLALFATLSNGAIAGFRVLSLAMMAACPCVYITIKPALQNLISTSGLSKKINIWIKSASMPLNLQP